MADTNDPLRAFTARLLEYRGAIVEFDGPGHLECYVPADVQERLGIAEYARLAFAPDPSPQSRQIGLDVEWLGRFQSLLDGAGNQLRVSLDVEFQTPGSPERMLEKSLLLGNAVYKLLRVDRIWTTYYLNLLRYTAFSEETRDGLLLIGINGATGNLIEEGADRLFSMGIEADSEALAFETEGMLPTEALARRLETALPERLDAAVAPFLSLLRRRMERDLARLHEYHDQLRRESLERLRKANADADRERLRLEAIAREYAIKLADLKEKYAMRVDAGIVQTLALSMPVARFSVLVKRRKGERRIALDWNPVTRKLEIPACEFQASVDPTREVCDDRLHIVVPTALGPCWQCGKSFCRVCFPVRCPKCGLKTSEATPGIGLIP
jgi:hypothetical protein